MTSGHRWSPDQTTACYVSLALSNGIRRKLCYSKSFYESFSDRHDKQMQKICTFSYGNVCILCHELCLL